MVQHIRVIVSLGAAGGAAHVERISSTEHSLLGTASAGLASLALASTHQLSAHSDDVQKLVQLSEESNAALLRGEGERYGEMISVTDDFTLMSPFGGEPSHGPVSAERWKQIGKFFANGKLQQELVQAYASPDMIVLATIERAHVEVGGLPVQSWALRVTLVYRREGSVWRLVHRHADPLAAGISLEEAAALGRGEHVGG